ncbi:MULTISPECIES: hypothetical protein [Microvirga]|uniref:hypothetical protein n=1 Tax=Microvirga TaxID=186650 RepID=UPI001B38AEE1|nr:MULTISPECIES: hypothetical protein [unclassified Microvirga]MBQ0819001.1 hypothetical protein [Microvirga sp. HBU67558]
MSVGAGVFDPDKGVLLEGTTGSDVPDGRVFGSPFYDHPFHGVRYEANDLPEVLIEEETILGTPGNDRLNGTANGDLIFADAGNDTVIGGGGDELLGEEGNDILYGDIGPNEPRDHVASDHDLPDGGPGDDTLVAGDGSDEMRGGTGEDRFEFRYHDPKSGSPGGHDVRAIAIDFNPKDNTFVFDAADFAVIGGANGNFVNNSDPSGTVSSFYSRAASKANGEHVVVITDQSFAGVVTLTRG